MSIHLPDNQYQGINAHLHSYLQQHGDWSMFHGEHITHLREALQKKLPPETGYFVVAEKSLQVVRDDPSNRYTSRRITIPDVGIYSTGGSTVPVAGGSVEAVPPGAVIAIVDTFADPETVNSVVIRRAQNDDDVLGKPVTRIELLSPANKPPGSHYPQYLTGREETLLGGVNLVELDYLHERRSHLNVLPDYPHRETHSYPYTILVSSPYPTLGDGKTEIYGFRVDDPLPVIRIPLDEGDAISFDLGEVYHHTFVQNALYGLRIVDYANMPENFASYDPVDQARIEDVMKRVSDASQ